MAKAARPTPPEQPATPSTSVRVGTATLRDVAELACVSKATVSRFVNSPEIVSPSVRERIQVAIDHLGWVPHAAARALATHRTGTIGAVVPTLANEHFATAIQVLQDELEEKGYTLLLGCSEYDLQREYRQVRKMLERGVDAIAVVGEGHHPDLYPLLDQRNVPCVSTFTFAPDHRSVCVGVDNYRAFYDATQYLVGLGHRRIAMIAQNADTNDRAAARREGVRVALAEHGIAIHPAHMAEGYWGVQEGRRLFSQIMAAPIEPPTAFICGNGSFATGAMLEAMAKGYDVPGQLSLIGFDDFEIMAELPIPITTVRVPSAEIGRRTADLLIAQLNGDRETQSIECEATLIVRESCAAPRTA
ncbi:LacI family DNA-binding transcriptional regulator [Burkholderia sp. Ac-20365]|uniref:LacI family DNA-binding transcriptional regulator n=1 Tax=Burkholderia sp. Ac-20365 TaxID=2703897 RepID=UPI00197C1685|nr:LacI family DNA-binding transcriptional regulator [Burkholderia sp. Ac-20365]MBN3766558.1 substrate-binding domain-containing protein [Burkholderia sp. Ac-20365]